MSVQVLMFVFPDGKTEYRTRVTRPTVGDVIRHRGEDLVVEQVDLVGDEGITVTVGPRLVSDEYTSDPDRE